MDTSKDQRNSLFEYYGFTKEDEKNYPVVSGILKELTPERIREENKKIRKIELPPEIKNWIKEYEKVGERSDYIWKWTYLGFKKVSLPTVLKRYRKLVMISKLSSIILNVLFDDLADKSGNKELIEKGIDICISGKNNSEIVGIDTLKTEDREYIDLIKRIWSFLMNKIHSLPRSEELKNLFLYDYRQFFNSIRYGLLVNEDLRLSNLTEYKNYLSSNMQGLIGGTIDLMASRNFDFEELGLIREILWRAQRMGRIGNSITTWKREVIENDFSSEIFAYLIINKIITPSEIREKTKDKLAEIIEESGASKYFFKEWTRYYKEIKELSRATESLKLDNILNGLENLLEMHLLSEGFK